MREMATRGNSGDRDLLRAECLLQTLDSRFTVRCRLQQRPQTSETLFCRIDRAGNSATTGCGFSGTQRNNEIVQLQHRLTASPTDDITLIVDPPTFRRAGKDDVMIVGKNEDELDSRDSGQVLQRIFDGLLGESPLVNCC